MARTSLLFRHPRRSLFASVVPFFSTYFAYPHTSILGIVISFVHPKNVRREFVHLLDLRLELFPHPRFVEIDLIDETK